MEISNTLQRLSNHLKNPEVLTNPEPFLGPNYHAVLRWWLYYESLTREQKDILWRRYKAIAYDTHNRARDLAEDAAVKVIGLENWWAVYYNVTAYGEIAAELIANLETPFFLPLLVPEFNYKQN